MEDLTNLFSNRAPSARRPLLGLTVLAVEDSRFASDAIRLMCLRSGARVRRADCVASARRHLHVYRPAVALIDIGLPDGSGTDLIEDLCRATPRISAILGMSGDPDMEHAAHSAGADGFLAKPLLSLGAFQETILAHLPDDRQPAGPREITTEIVVPDPMAYRDDMAHVAELLGEDQNDKVLCYIANFLVGVASSAADTQLANAARSLTSNTDNGQPLRSDVARIAGLVQERLNEKVAI